MFVNLWNYGDTSTKEFPWWMVCATIVVVVLIKVI